MHHLPPKKPTKSFLFFFWIVDEVSFFPPWYGIYVERSRIRTTRGGSVIVYLNDILIYTKDPGQGHGGKGVGVVVRGILKARTERKKKKKKKRKKRNGIKNWMGELEGGVERKRNALLAGSWWRWMKEHVLHTNKHWRDIKGGGKKAVK